MGYSIQDVREEIEVDGLAYAVMDGLSPGDIEDSVLSEMWGEAQDLLAAISWYLAEPQAPVLKHVLSMEQVLEVYHSIVDRER